MHCFCVITHTVRNARASDVPFTCANMTTKMHAHMSGNFIVYLIGYIIAIIGVAYGLSAAGLGQQWIIAVVLIMAGLGIVYALSRSQRDEGADRSARTESSAAGTGTHETPRDTGERVQGR